MHYQPKSFLFFSFMVFSYFSFIVGFSHAAPLIYSTYLGGNLSDEGNSIAIDSVGHVFITGNTYSSNFPVTTGAYDTTGLFDNDDIYITKLNIAGTVLMYSTYLGGSNVDESYSIAVDTIGNAYLCGFTSSTDFPVSSGAFDTSQNGNYDGFVSKLNPTGTALIYSTFIGGENYDQANDIALDSLGNAYITGDTWSAYFPTTATALDTTLKGYEDGFICKLNPTGTGLVYSSYWGGSNFDWGNAVAVDSSGNAYLTGVSNSPDFPITAAAFDTSYHGKNDVVVSKFNLDGTGLIYSTYLGDTCNEEAYDIAIDPFGNTYITGYTTSPDFPITLEAIDTVYRGDEDGFVSKLNANGTELIYSTYLGGSYYDWGNAITVDPEGNAYITGYTSSPDYPTTFGALAESLKGIDDGIIAQLNADGTELLYSTYLGGSNDDECSGIAIDSSNNLYITGVTNYSDFPTTSTSFDTSLNGYSDAFIIKMKLVAINHYFNNYSEFTISSDFDHWYWEKHSDSITAGTLSWSSTYMKRSGIAKITQNPGDKGKLTQLFSVPSTGWYTAKAMIATDIAEMIKQQKVYLYLQELDESNAIIATGNIILQPGAGGFGTAGVWRELKISFYAQHNILGVQVVAINPANSGITGSLYIDSIRVAAGAPVPTRPVKVINNSFASGTTSWILEPYGDASYAGIWTTAWSVLALSQDGGMKGKSSQLIQVATTFWNNVYATVQVYSDATSISDSQKVYLYIYSYDSGYTKIIESGNAILQPGKWAPGQWHQLQFEFPPLTPYNVVQLVGINPLGNPWSTIYFDNVAVKQ
ncbi:MAG: SBBP repeat-containing protein [bacterium]